MNRRDFDIVIIGSGAGGGTVAAELSDLVSKGVRILVLERGPRLQDHEFTGKEVEMASALYADRGGFLTSQGTLSLAFCHAYGGTTVVYTGTSLIAPRRVIDSWQVPGLPFEDLKKRSEKYMAQNNVHFLDESLINENNKLFVQGCKVAGYEAHQFPLNLKGCLGSGLCNLGCPNAAKQGTHRVQLPLAESRGVEVVTRAEVVALDDHQVRARISEKQAGEKGLPSEWPPGDYEISAKIVVLAGGVMGSAPLLLKSRFTKLLPRLGEGFTCHPVHILVAEHERPITNFFGHPKSYYVDRAPEENFVLETCMYYPFTTAKNLTGFGAQHEYFLRAFPRLQMILVLACDRALAHNRVRVNRKGKSVVDYHFTPAVIRALIAATRASAKIFFGAGARAVHAPAADPPLLEAREFTSAQSLDSRIHEKYFQEGKISLSAAHLMGGCRMGNTAKDSVTDSWGRVHGVPWLRVADASLFPDALQINPYLTIMALADRVSEGIRKDGGY